MGASASVLGVSASVLFVGVGCFAVGYLLAHRRSLYLSASPSPSSPFTSDDSDEDEEAKEKATKKTRSRSLFFWARSALAMPVPSATSREPRGSKPKKKQKPPPLEIETLAEILEDFKMVLVVRNDLKMGKGKIGAQCSHATLGLYKKLYQRAPKSLRRWEMCGQVKVVVKIESEEEMLVLQERAKSLRLPTHITIDAGRTQIAPNSRTVMAILGPADLVDDVTGGLKLL
ncbi:peptidyl-tRNA hydrolase 2, mitochondrial-like isoform X1 [Ananas comosus]|uniref:peptidyl-tRNA hydrolase n=2 Tax=Ananas comosus TaxID=4615 RepID=A0A6P5H0C6_ANACO|nr:peptidyl-tRNA hydrolase 2, mitochondrial-like isoform X1 [Ananas comosus]